ncbi:MAG: trigger factor [Prochlorococcaceae cyanobacterium]|jgi:trigger factor
MATALSVKSSPRPGSRLALEVGVPGGRSQACYDAALERLSRSVRLPGFRKGRVPRQVLLQQLGPVRVRATALEELVESACRDALAQENVAALGQPEISDGFEALLDRYQPGEELVLTLELDVAPTPSLRMTRGLAVEAEAVAFDPARVDEMLSESRRQLATLVPVEDRAAAVGDVAVIDFTGTFSDSGEAIQGGQGEGLEVELEEGRMIPGFVEGMIGQTVGESRQVTCCFPDTYPQEDCRGREASFSITLRDLKARELPDLDDAFAQRASDSATMAELRIQLEQRLRDEAERRTRSNRREALLKALVEQLDVELPETLIRQEINALLQETAAEMAQQGLDVKKLFTPEVVRNLASGSREEATARLRRSLALQALAREEGISVGADALEAKLSEVRAGLSDSSRIDPQRLRQAVEEDLLQDQLFLWLEEHSTVSEPAAGSAPDGEAAATPKAKPRAKAKPKAKDIDAESPSAD